MDIPPFRIHHTDMQFLIEKIKLLGASALEMQIEERAGA